MLTTDQQNAYNKLINWLGNSDHPVFILGGVAGSGKSYLTKLFAGPEFNIKFAATTNKAAQVLSNMSGKEATTVHKLLGLKPLTNEDQLFFEHDGSSTIYKGDVVLIDESSMIGKKMFKEIDREIDRGVRFIFVGDPIQLPPVNDEGVSPIWEFLKDKENSALLLECVRNDNQLLNLATKVRKCVQTSFFYNPVADDFDALTNSGVKAFPSFIDFRKKFLHDIPNIDFKDTRFIAWRNTTVNHYNEIVRSALGYKEDWIQGEIIICGSPIIRKIEDNKKVVIANVDDEFIINTVDKISVYIQDFDVDVDTYKIVTDQGMTLFVAKNKDEITTLLKMKGDKIRGIKDKTAQKKAWKSWWSLKEMFDDIRYSYAMTAHRTQGSTLKACYVDSKDILANQNKKEAYQCLYVAVTRPTDSLYIY